jgi:pilus assembly protein Flp/PilA
VLVVELANKVVQRQRDGECVCSRFLCFIRVVREIKMKNLMADFIIDESGVTAIEYGLIAALIGVVLTVALISTGNNISSLFSSLAACFSAAGC